MLRSYEEMIFFSFFLCTGMEQYPAFTLAVRFTTVASL
jgi:hypothetical protein